MKEKIIHWLGGYTKKDLDFNYAMGEANTVESLIQIAKDINGCSADEWCKQMWLTLLEKRNNGIERMA